jgi:predicted nucleotide-binding protein (sugar kinase/HSP70/actin superfamily)
MIGGLLEALHDLEAEGLSREAIIDQFVFFTAGSCGPCRFGMYEAEFRLALQNAGFDGFRVLLFQQGHGIKAASGAPGLQFTLNLGLGALNAFNIGDVIQDLAYRIRPYEVTAGETDRAVDDCLTLLAQEMRGRHPEPLHAIPPWLAVLARRYAWLRETINAVGKLHFHLHSGAHHELLARCRDRLDRVEVDRTRVKPVVKITGEFWAQTTEGDGNYRMFTFLEQEGAEVRVEPVATWVMYLLHHAKSQAEVRKGLEVAHPAAPWWRVGKRAANVWPYWKRRLLFCVAEAFYAREFHRTAQALGGLTGHLASQRELARLAHPFYHSLSRGGEGHLEVAKNVYYTVNRRCHMVLSLKPFGCMPSSQSDGVQSAVVNRFPDMIFLPIETSGEGEVNAHSRAQMALSDAKAKARAEFDAALASTGRRLEDIRAYVAKRSELRRPFHRVPRQPGVAGTAAAFVQHVGRLMAGEQSRRAPLPAFFASFAGEIRRGVPKRQGRGGGRPAAEWRP